MPDIHESNRRLESFRRKHALDSDVNIWFDNGDSSGRLPFTPKARQPQC